MQCLRSGSCLDQSGPMVGRERSGAFGLTGGNSRCLSPYWTDSRSMSSDMLHNVIFILPAALTGWKLLAIINAWQHREFRNDQTFRYYQAGGTNRPGGNASLLSISGRTANSGIIAARMESGKPALCLKIGKGRFEFSNFEDGQIIFRSSVKRNGAEGAA